MIVLILYLLLSCVLIVFTFLTYKSTLRKYKSITESEDKMVSSCSSGDKGIQMKVENDKIVSEDKMLQYTLSSDSDLANKLVIRASTGGGFVHLPFVNEMEESETTGYVCPMSEEGEFRLVL